MEDRWMVFSPDCKVRGLLDKTRTTLVLGD